MKRLSLILLLAICTFFVTTSRPAHAATTGSTHIACCDAVVLTGGSTYPYVALQLYYNAGRNVIVDSNTGAGGYEIVPVTNGSWSITYHFPAVPQGTQLIIAVYASDTGSNTPNNWNGDGAYPVYIQTCAGSFPVATPTPSSTPATGWPPNDNRVDARPNDRIAVYCPSSTQLTVIVTNASMGIGYAVFSLTDLVNAGKRGVYKPALSYSTNQPANLGTVSVQLTRSNGITYFYVAWNDGQFKATGQGDFVKMFTSPNTYCNLA